MPRHELYNDVLTLLKNENVEGAKHFIKSHNYQGLGYVLTLEDLIEVPSIAVVNALINEGVYVSFNEYYGLVNFIEKLIKIFNGDSEFLTYQNKSKEEIEQCIVNGIGAVLLLKVHPFKERYFRYDEDIDMPEIIINFMRTHRMQVQFILSQIQKLYSIIDENDGAKQIRKTIVKAYGAEDGAHMLAAVARGKITEKHGLMGFHKNQLSQRAFNASITHLSMANFMNPPAKKGGSTRSARSRGGRRQTRRRRR